MSAHTLRPLHKEELFKFKNDKQVQERMFLIKGDVQYIYNETILTAVNGGTKYIFSLNNRNFLQEHNGYIMDKEKWRRIYIQELIRELYDVFPDLTIHYDTRKLYDLQERETIIPCIIIDWL